MSNIEKFNCKSVALTPYQQSIPIVILGNDFFTRCRRCAGGSERALVECQICAAVRSQWRYQRRRASRGGTAGGGGRSTPPSRVQRHGGHPDRPTDTSFPAPPLRLSRQLPINTPILNDVSLRYKKAGNVIWERRAYTTQTKLLDFSKWKITNSPAYSLSDDMMAIIYTPAAVYASPPMNIYFHFYYQEIKIVAVHGVIWIFGGFAIGFWQSASSGERCPGPGRATTVK